MRKFLKALSWVISFQFIGFLIGQMTKNNIDTWYVHLIKSPLNPPQLVFPIAWSILYVMIALSGYCLFESKEKDNALAKIFYIIQIIMNWTWTPIFFGLHQIKLSFIWIIFVGIFTLLTIIASFKKNICASILLMPYFIWVIFASYLNYYIFVHN